MSFFGNTTPKTPSTKKKFANIRDREVNSNQQAVPVKYLSGRRLVAGDFISPAYNPRAVPIQTQAAKGSSGTITGYNYFCDFALMFCTGGRRPVDGLYKVVVDSDIVWSSPGGVLRTGQHYETIQVPKFGTLRLYWGDETQPIDSVLLTPRATPIGGGSNTDSTTWPPNAPVGGQHTFGGFASGDWNPFSGHYDQHPAYRGQCYGVFTNWLLGRDRTSVPNIMLELKRGCPWFNGAFIASDNIGVNPLVVLFDWLTDTRFGMGFPESSLLSSTWINTYNTLESMGPARISPIIAQQMEFRQAVAQLLEYFDGWIRRSGSSIEVGLWSHGTPVSSATLTDDNLLGDPELVPQGWGPTVNEVTVVYNDRQQYFNDYVQVYRDPNNFRITGAPKPDILQRPWITDKDLAKSYARTYGAILALPFCSGTLHVKREWLTATSMLPGKLFTYNSAFYGLSFLMRLQDVEYPADKDAKASLTVEWDRSKWPSLYIPPGFQGPGGFVLGPRAIWRSRITEIPYLLEDHRFLTQIVALAVKGNVELVGFRIQASFDAGATYQDIADTTNNFGFYGRLNADIAAHAPAAQSYFYGPGLDNIVSQTSAQQSDDTLLCFIDGEVMSVGTVVSIGSGLFHLFVLRGRLGTTDVLHTANADMFFIFRSQMRALDNAQFIPGNTVLFKLQPFTREQDFDLASITPVSYVISGWAQVSPPVFSPPGGTFFGSVLVRATAQAGMVIRYTHDGAEVNGSSPIFPVAGKTLTATTTLRAMAFASNGRVSPERMAAYTRTLQVPPPPQCSPPNWDFTGIQGYSTGNLTLTATTVGSTIKFILNGGSIQTYSTPIFLHCNDGGDSCEFWATKAGSGDSAHVTFDNTRIGTRGGGHGPPHPPP